MSRRNPRQPTRDRIFEYLQILRIPYSESEFDQLMSTTDKEKISYSEFLERVLSGPANRRRERSIERRIRNARFRAPATLESFDWKFNAATIKRQPFEELANGDFVHRRDNLLFVGKSGTGKSHLIQGIGRRMCTLGYRVRYITSADLLEDLTAASGDKTLPSRIRYYSRFELLLIDEFGFDKLERREYAEAPSLLFKVIDRRNGRGSTALVTNVKLSDWTDYLGDPPLAMALLDRIVDGSVILEFSGKSYRADRAKRRGTSCSGGTTSAP